MSFHIILYSNSSAPEKLDKTLSEIVDLTGTLKDASSFIDPTVMIEATQSQMAACNYIRIPQFERYYFVKNITVLRTGLYQLDCHVDVLTTYKAGIRKNSAIIERSQKDYELNLDDGSIKVNNNPTIQTKSFPQGFTTSLEFVLAVAGGSGS